MIGGWERCLKFGEGRGGEGRGKLRCVVAGGRELSLSFSFSACLAALKGVMESGERRIHHHHHHYYGV